MGRGCYALRREEARLAPRRRALIPARLVTCGELARRLAQGEAPWLSLRLVAVPRQRRRADAHSRRALSLAARSPEHPSWLALVRLLGGRVLLLLLLDYWTDSMKRARAVVRLERPVLLARSQRARGLDRGQESSWTCACRNSIAGTRSRDCCWTGECCETSTSSRSALRACACVEGQTNAVPPTDVE